MIAERESGFTLIEMLVGIAVTSILLIAVFQFLGDLITLRSRLFERGKRVHQRVALADFLHRDLSAVPRGEMSFRTNRNEFSRRTVSRETPESKLLDTRVRYSIEKENGRDHLYRYWRWSEIRNSFQEGERLLSAPDIILSYRRENGQWHQTPLEDERPRAVRIEWNKQSVVVPVVPAERTS